MKKIALWCCALLVVLSCVEPVVEEPPREDKVYRLPEPERVFFYRDGTTVYGAKIPAEAIIENAFVLPEQTDVSSFTIFQDGERLFSYSLERTVLSVQLLEQDPDNPERPLVSKERVLLVSIPELAEGVPLEIRFGIGKSGINWGLILDMQHKEPSSLDSNLLASINADAQIDRSLQYILAQRPEIILISSQNVFLERADSVFNLGRSLIQPGKNTFQKLEGGESAYRLVYYWDADNQDQPAAYLRCVNPFASSISRVMGNLNSNGININQYASLQLIPGRTFDLMVGYQPRIRTFKSARTQEFPKREELPFTHNVEYTVTNQLTERAEIEISIPVQYGTVHRTQYRFKKPPDERPGDRMVWKYSLAPGASATVEFSYDAERKDNDQYSQYDYYSGGR